MSLQFDIIAKDGRARTGVLHTPHGDVHTPTITTNFTPALLRSQLNPSDLRPLGIELILINAFHAHGSGVKDAHQELGWVGPILSDSGGFQMVSLAGYSRVHRNGVKFFWDNRWHNLTSEQVTQWQKDMGVDIIMPLDKVTHVLGKNPLKFWDSVFATKRWFRRSYSISPERTFYIVQGGLNYQARSFSLRDARHWLADGTPGVAIGGLAGGEDRQAMYQMVQFCTDRLPVGKPRHLFGIGTPKDLLEGIERGIDTFDCVAHTREGRHGRLWTSHGILDLAYNRHAKDGSVIEMGCDCPICARGITRAELINDISHYSDTDSKERQDQRVQAWRNCMLHNVRFIARLMGQSREAIQEGRFLDFKKEFLEKFCQR